MKLRLSYKNIGRTVLLDFGNKVNYTDISVASMKDRTMEVTITNETEEVKQIVSDVLDKLIVLQYSTDGLGITLYGVTFLSFE